MQRYAYAIIFVTIVFIKASTTSFCEKLHQEQSPADRNFSLHGEQKNITVYWDSEPARAIGSLFAAILRHTLGYNNVEVLETTEHLREINNTENIIFSLSSSWINKSSELNKIKKVVKLKYRQIHVYLAKNYRKKEQCKNVNQLIFYNNISTLEECGFVNHDIRRDHILNVYQLNSTNITTIETLTDLLNKSSLQLETRIINRTTLYQMLNTGNVSFLFIDYGIWGKELPLLQCVSGDTCYNKFQGTVDLFVADYCRLKEFAPQLVYTADQFSPSEESLKRIMEGDSKEKSIMEAACKWVLENKSTISKWSKYKAKEKKILITVLLCKNKPDLNKIYKTVIYLIRRLKRDKRIPLLHFMVPPAIDNCYEPNEVLNKIKSQNICSDLMVMIVDGDVKNKLEVAKVLEGQNVLIFFFGASIFNVATIQANTTTSLWYPKGGSLHLGLALLEFIVHDMKWRRMAVISEESQIAEHLFEDLTHLRGIFLRNYHIRNDLSISETEKVLRNLQLDNARIILVNTNKEIADVIISVAERLRMNIENGYAYIVREWDPTNKKYNMTLYSISFGCRYKYDVAESRIRFNIRKEINILWPKVWPSQVTAIADAIFTLADGFNKTFTENSLPTLQSKQIIKYFERTLEDKAVVGLCQTLTYKNHSLEETVMFVDKWHGNKRTLLANYRVNATARSILDKGVYDTKYTEHHLHDGRTECLLQAGDPYQNTCYDLLCISLASLIVIVPCAFIISRSMPKTRTVRVQAPSKEEFEKRSCLLPPSEKTSPNPSSDFDSGFSDGFLPEINIP